jgi:hypothetical protein
LGERFIHVVEADEINDVSEVFVKASRELALDKGGEIIHRYLFSNVG